VALRIEQYAIVGDTQTAALVGDDGAIDWMCAPRFDSDALFAALLGDAGNGRWLIAPSGRSRPAGRRYRPGTLVLETDLAGEDGILRVTDCMPPRRRDLDVVRVAECVRGRVAVRMELQPRLGYGRTTAWVRAVPGGAELIAGPDGLRLAADVPVSVSDGGVVADFELGEGERAGFVLTWHPSNERPPRPPDAFRAVEETDRHWRGWSARCAQADPWQEPVVRSLLTLKALTYAPTGGIIAAATTSLPARIGGVRNWDYRFCWVRDATFTLMALIEAGYTDEARAWRDWLLRAAAGRADELQVMYGPAGERRLTELELPWLPGYEGSRPVRIGNAASSQLQLDVYGELVDCMHQALLGGLPYDPDAWSLQRALLEHLEKIWREPDEGIWEVRGGRRDFTHSKVMAWAAFDRAVANVEHLGLEGPVDRWRAHRDEIHREVCERAYDPAKRAFVQSYGSHELDASLLLIPLVGFLPPTDARVSGTIDAVRRELVKDGLVMRYRSESRVDGLPPGEGTFLPCSFWLADCLAVTGHVEEARALFERLLSLRNDLGLLSEEYDTEHHRLVGNFPQAFSHVALVNTALNLAEARTGPAERRPRRR
jgi:GH15 family glucan-1,4-alpha-glucosidase